MDSLNEVHPSLTGRVLVIQLLDWIFRGVAQVMFVNNPLSGLLITTGLFLQEPWWALNSLLGTVVSTVSAILLGQNRSDGISPLLLLLHQRILKKKQKKNILLLPQSHYHRLFHFQSPGATISLAFTLCYSHGVFFS